MLRTSLLVRSLRGLAFARHQATARPCRPACLPHTHVVRPYVTVSETEMLQEASDDEDDRFQSDHADLLTAFICKALVRHHNKSGACHEDIYVEEAQGLLGNLSHLVSLGCHAHELMEAPAMLYCSHTELVARLAKLSQCDVTSISLPLLSRANPSQSEATVRQEIQTYLRYLDGKASSVSGLYQHLLQCSDNSLVEMLCKSPPLVSSRQSLTARYKIEYLLENGWPAEAICESCLVLSYSSMKIIEERVTILRQHNLHGKVPLYILRMTLTMFEKMTKKYKKWDVDVCGIATALGTTTSVLGLIPIFHAPLQRVLPEKVRFLMGIGYTGQQIVDSAGILTFSLNRIRAASEELLQQGVGMPDLSMLRNFVCQQQLPVTVTERSNINFVAKLLQCHSSKLKIYAKKNSFKLQKKDTLLCNYTFLQEQCGFNATMLQELPYLLAHNPTVLEAAWDRLKQHACFTTWQAKPFVLMNMLQYEVEKTCNFNHHVVL